jgi:DNA polymerase IIIc chi subunit
MRGMSACIFHDTAASEHDRRIFEITEEAYGRRENVVIYAGSESRAAEIDRFLWILKQESFIPHGILKGYADSVAVPVSVVTQEWNPCGSAILIADGHCSLEYASGFRIIHEFVDRSSPAKQEACRERFRRYRDKGIPVEYLKTGAWKGSRPE